MCILYTINGYHDILTYFRADLPVRQELFLILQPVMCILYINYLVGQGLICFVTYMH